MLYTKHMVKLMLGGIILLFIIILGSYVYINSTAPKKAIAPSLAPTASVLPPASPAPSSQPQVSSLPQTGQNRYQDPKGVYVISFPAEYTQDEENNGQMMRLSKRGATQQGQTEMYDGIIVVFESIALPNQSLSSWTDAYIRSTTSDGTLNVVEAKKPTTVHNYPGYTFSLQGLGTSKYIVVHKDASSSAAVMMTMLVADPNQLGYQHEVDSILATLQLEK